MFSELLQYYLGAVEQIQFSGIQYYFTIHNLAQESIKSSIDGLSFGRALLLVQITQSLIPRLGVGVDGHETGLHLLVVPGAGTGDAAHGEEHAETRHPESQPEEEHEPEPMLADCIVDQVQIIADDDAVEAGDQPVVGVHDAVHCRREARNHRIKGTLDTGYLGLVVIDCRLDCRQSTQHWRVVALLELVPVPAHIRQITDQRSTACVSSAYFRVEIRLASVSIDGSHVQASLAHCRACHRVTIGCCRRSACRCRFTGNRVRSRGGGHPAVVEGGHRSAAVADGVGECLQQGLIRAGGEVNNPASVVVIDQIGHTSISCVDLSVKFSIIELVDGAHGGPKIGQGCRGRAQERGLQQVARLARQALSDQVDILRREQAAQIAAEPTGVSK